MAEPEPSSPEAILALAGKIAAKRGYALNPDADRLRRLAKRLGENLARHGRRYCPCKQSYPLRPDADPVCPCPTLADEIERQGHCVCHLFYAPEAAARRSERPGLLAGVACPG